MSILLLRKIIQDEDFGDNTKKSSTIKDKQEKGDNEVERVKHAEKACFFIVHSFCTVRL